MLLFGATIAPTNDSARCSLRRNVVLTQSAAIGYLAVVPSAVYLHDYLAVAYPLADGALTVQQSLDAQPTQQRFQADARCCAGVNGSMEEMHNIGWFILAYVAFLLVGRVVDAVRIVPRRSAARATATLLAIAFRRPVGSPALHCGLMGGALWAQGWHNMYEMLWACNIAMVLAGYGIITDRPSENSLSARRLSHPRAIRCDSRACSLLMFCLLGWRPIRLQDWWAHRG